MGMPEGLANMHEAVYELSKRYSPPQTNLRDAEVLDCYGDDLAPGPDVDHQVPEDVTREDLDAYPWVFVSYFELEDLLFYLWPIAREFSRDQNLECVHYFLIGLNGAAYRFRRLSLADQRALKEGLEWIGGARGEATGARWESYPGIQRFFLRAGERD